VRSRAAVAATAALVILLSGCGKGAQSGAAAGGRGGPNGPTTVGYVVVQQGSAPLEQELPGRVAAFQVSEVRPQVSGVVQRRLFQEGSFVRQGQTLY
jgi:membrane fusion protein, multidrug efflux system